MNLKKGEFMVYTPPKETTCTSTNMIHLICTERQTCIGIPRIPNRYNHIMSDITCNVFYKFSGFRL